MIKVFVLLYIFVFGLIIGSFLNSVIYRLHKKKDLIFARSICPHCKHTLSFFDLIPVFSFLFLKGKCRYCKKPISWQYPAVELSCGFLFVLITYFLLFSSASIESNTFEVWFSWICYLLIFSVLVVIFVYDLKYLIIPDSILLLGIFFSIILIGFLSFQGSYLIILDRILGVILISGFFLLQFLFSKGKWIGFGDVKLGILLGLILGWEKSLLMLFLSYLIGGIISLGLIGFKKKNLKSEIPFGPFLILSTIISYFLGDKIISWYLNQFL